MDHRIMVLLASVLAVLAVVVLAWYVVSRVATAAPAKIAVVIVALATFVGAVATVIQAFGPAS